MLENHKHNEITKEDTVMIIRQMDSFDLDDVVKIEKESFSDAWSKIGSWKLESLTLKQLIFTRNLDFKKMAELTDITKLQKRTH